MRRERSTSLASSKSKGNLNSTNVRTIQPKLNLTKANISSRISSPSPLSKLNMTRTPLKSLNIQKQQTYSHLSKEKSLTRLSSKKFIQTNKENLNPNLISQVQVSAKEKNRTIKDVRLQNTKKEGLALSKNITQASSKRNTSQNKISIFIHPPKERIIPQTIDRKRISDNLQLEEVEPMLKYIPPISQSRKVVLSDFQVLRTLSESAYFRDLLCLHKLTCSIYTLRIIDKEQVRSEQRQRQLMESLKVQLFMNKLHLPHVQRLYTVFEDPCSIYLLMEPVVRLNQLSRYSELDNRYTNTLEQKEIAIFVKQILQTLQQAHRNSLLLRTLDVNFIKMYIGVVKIGLLHDACSLKQRKRRKSFLGSITTMPHQLAQGRQYDYTYDLWSLGLAVYHLAVGIQPFEVSQPLAAIQSLQYDIPMNLSKELGSFINGLLTDQAQRLSVSQALQHPFLKQSPKQKLLIPKQLWSFWQSN